MRTGAARRARITALIALAAGAGGCAVPPWSMGMPLTGKPSIPATTEAPSIRSLRALAAAERTAGHTALELQALAAIHRADRLGQEDERQRLAVLLERRARELLAIDRTVPACADLRDLEELAPARARELVPLHAPAEREAGDAWLGVGDLRRAHEAYEIAGALGAAGIDFRLIAAGDPPPARADSRMAERAVLELPLRAVPPFATMYLDGGAAPPAAGAATTAIGEGPDGLNALDRAALVRALRAARQEKQLALAVRIQSLLGAGEGGARPEPSAPPTATNAGPPIGAPVSAQEGAAAERLAESLLDTPAAPSPPQPPLDVAQLDEWVVGAASVSSRLLPLLEDAARQLPPDGAVPAAGVAALLAPGPRARRWAELLLDEDPTSPDVLEVTAVIDALAGRVGGAERKLADLVYFTPDRYQGLVRAAAIWERVGQARLGCVAWLRAARWRDEIDDPAWARTVACMRHDPGAGDWRAVMAYILDQTPPAGRAAAAVALDPTGAPLGAPAAPPLSDRPAGAPIPCDTGGSPR